MFPSRPLVSMEQDLDVLLDLAGVDELLHCQEGLQVAVVLPEDSLQQSEDCSVLLLLSAGSS